VSVWSGAQVAAACRAAETWRAYKPVTNQPPYNLLERGIESEVVPECAKLGVGQIVFSPLAQGLLTGKYADGVPRDSRAADDKRNSFIKPRMTAETLAKARAAEIARAAGLAPAAAALACACASRASARRSSMTRACSSRGEPRGRRPRP
jgi:aryl-alcohol dehydrogenase-like predicted oxidoreductase